MEELKGVYINGYNGELIQITNIDEALRQARGAVSFHDNKMKNKKINPETIIYPEAQKEWVHNLLELEKLEMKFKSLPKKEEPKKEEGPFYSETVTKAREMFGENGEKGFLRNNCSSPLYGINSTWLVMSSNSRIRLRLLEVGESTKNSSGTIITRAR